MFNGFVYMNQFTWSISTDFWGFEDIGHCFITEKNILEQHPKNPSDTGFAAFYRPWTNAVLMNNL